MFTYIFIHTEKLNRGNYLFAIHMHVMLVILNDDPYLASLSCANIFISIIYVYKDHAIPPRARGYICTRRQRGGGKSPPTPLSLTNDRTLIQNIEGNCCEKV